LKELPYAKGAAFNSADNEHDQCLENTRVDLLNQVQKWATDVHSKDIFWLKGIAGTGKSTIARTVAYKLAKQGCLGASFFFSRGKGDRSHARLFFTSLAIQLVELQPSLIPYVYQAINGKLTIADQTPGDQWAHLILGPLTKCRSPIAVVVDALDECDYKDAAEILELFKQLKDLDHVPLRIFITSRPEVSGFKDIPKAMLDEVALHEDEGSEHDISLFLEHKLREIKKNRCKERKDWPGKEAIQYLTQRAGKLFIYASTICRFIDVEIYYDEYLSKILEDDKTGMGELYQIYTRILENAVPRNLLEDTEKKFRASLNSIVGTIIVLFSPLSVDGLAKLLQQKDGKLINVEDYLFRLRSVLDVPDDRDSPIRLFHLSFHDFFLDDRRENENFWAFENETHRGLVNRCLDIMSNTLKKDLCKLGKPDCLASEIDQNLVKICLPAHVQYACRYWIRHLQQSGILHHHEEVLHFLKKHFLHWLEALSFMRQMSEGVLAIQTLKSILTVSTAGLLIRSKTLT